MSIFRRPDYTSEVTQFIDGLKTQKPSLEAEQRAGRALLWDKQLDRSAEQDYQDARVAQQPYVYLTSQHPNGQ
jgi:cell division septal protein FtsQ